MEVSSTTSSARGFFPSLDHVRFRMASRTAEARATSPLDTRSLERLVARLDGARTHLAELLKAEIRPSDASRAAGALSSGAIDLETTATATTLRSTGEVNATTTSFSPAGPDFSGVSSSLPTVGGIYSGTNGDDDLTFRVTIGGIVGVGVLQLEVRNSQNELVDTLAFTGVAADTPVDLANGLTLALSNGTIVAGDTFEVAVSATTGSSVDPDAPFDGTRNQNPNFETGTSVGAGSFRVNGTTISVLADDTVNQVLQKITASVAGVTAVFDAAAERVVLTQKTPGSGHSISVDNDTSGFLAAVKLDGATPVAGADDEASLPISAVPGLSAIQTGFFEINGESIAIDTSVDSLDDVIQRINVSGAGAIATLRTEVALFSVKSSSTGDDLALSDGNSNFFSALSVAPGIYESRRESGARRFANADAFTRSLGRLRNDMNRLFQRPLGVASDTVDRVHSRLREAISAAFEPLVSNAASRSILRSGLGLDFDFSGNAAGAVELDLVDLNRALDKDFEDVESFLFGQASPLARPGLFQSVDAALEELAAEIDQPGLLGGSLPGVLIDVLA